MKPMGAGLSGATQFEGRTAEEAVARARAALGESSALRCWKTRRGGVGGFFAREVFVASLTPPPGSEVTRGRVSRAESGGASGGSDRASVIDGSPLQNGAPEHGPEPAESAGALAQELEEESAEPEDLLAGLVEATSDQVSLRSLAIPAEAFDQVLAEAEAALTRGPTGNGATTPRSPTTSTPQSAAVERASVSEHEPAPLDDEKAEARPGRRGSATAPNRPKSPERAEPAAAKKETRPNPRAGRQPARSRATTAAKYERRGRPARIQDLRPGLRNLGVPDSYLPRGQCPSLDLLAGILATLPVPPVLPTRSGAVVAVVGTGQHLDRTVDLVAAELSLGQNDVLGCGGSVGADRHRPMGPTSAEGPRLGRQIARRRASGRTSVVALHAGPGTPNPREACRLLERASPDYVLAAVGAQCKRADVEHWIGELPTVDALALWDLSGTRTPAELLGVLPIAFVEGEACSPLGWTLALASRAMERGR